MSYSPVTMNVRTPAMAVTIPGRGRLVGVDVPKSTPHGRSIITCSNCRESAPNWGGGRCNLCGQYFWTKGVERSQELIERARMRKLGQRLCRRCKSFKPVGEFYEGQWDCKPCQLLNLNEWRQRHPEYVPLYKRDADAYARHRRAANAWRKTAKGKAMQRRQTERSRQRERTDPTYRARRQEIMRRVKAKRGRRLREQFVAPVDFDYIVRRDKGRCAICRRRVNLALRNPHPMCASLDHIIPLSLGGTHEPRNVQLAHKRCNSRKWTKAAPQGDQLMLIG